MRKPVFASLLVVALLAGSAFAVECVSLGTPDQAFGYSSDEVFGGSSYLGVDTRDVTADRLGALQLKEESGVEVTMVDQDAPAGKAGIKEHDVIMTINGQQVESVEQLRRMIHEIPPGRVVTIGLSRNGQPLTVKAQLADRKKAFAFMSPGKDFHFAMPAIPPIPPIPDIDVPMSVVVVHSSVRSGLMVENLTPQLGDFFGVKDGQGVLVRSVEKGSRGEKAGFRAGDVIVKVNGQTVSDTGDFTHALHARKDNTVTVTVVRDKKEQTITLSLPEHRQSGSIEEGSDFPYEVGIETHIDLGELRSEMANLRPQIELAVQQARQMSAEARKAVAQNRKEICKQRQEMKKQAEHLRKQLQEEKQKLREEIRQRMSEI